MQSPLFFSAFHSPRPACPFRKGVPQIVLGVDRCPFPVDNDPRPESRLKPRLLGSGSVTLTSSAGPRNHTKLHGTRGRQKVRGRSARFVSPREALKDCPAPARSGSLPTVDRGAPNSRAIEPAP